MTKSHLFGAAATIVGTVVGAGILGIPYVISQTGVTIGMIQLLVIGLIFILLNLYMGEIVLRTKGNHQLTGYAEKYIGKKGKILMTLSMVLGTWIALVAYGVGTGQVIAGILGWGNPITYGVILFLVLSTILSFGINILENMEKLLVTVMVVIVVVIILQTIPFLRMDNLTTINYTHTISSFGVIFFAYLGSVSIVEAKEILGKKRHLLRRAIILGMTIPMIIYALFAFFVVGVTGANTTEVATIGLGLMSSKYIILIGNILALFTMSTSFLALGFAVKEMFQFDYKLKKNKALFCTLAVPFIIVTLNLTGFINALSIAGALEGGIISTLIIFMILKAKKKSDRKPEFTTPINKPAAVLIVLFFAAVMVYQVAKTFGLV